MIAAVLAVATAHAQTPAALIYDAKIGPITFGAGDLKTALAGNGYAVTVLPSGNPAQAKQSVRIILTTKDAKLPGQPATKGIEVIRRAKLDCILMAVNAADRHYLSFIEHLLPAALEKQMGIIGMKVATRGRLLSTWKPEPLAEQPERMRTPKPGAITMAESLAYNFSLPMSTNIVGVDNVEQLEADVRCAATFVPLNPAQMQALEQPTLPVVRQALYFRRWDLGA